MLGLSFGKLVLLIIVILVVWYGYKYVARLEQIRQALYRARRAAEAQRQGGAPPRLKAEDMVKCRACGAYVAAEGAGRCSRGDCPW